MRPNSTLPGNASGASTHTAASGKIARRSPARPNVKLSSQNTATVSHMVADKASAKPKRKAPFEKAASRINHACAVQRSRIALRSA